MVRVIYILLLEVLLQCAVFMHDFALRGCWKVLLKSIADAYDAIEMITDCIS